MTRNINRDPLVLVVKAHACEGTTGFGFCHGRGVSVRWWDLTLECGHVVERPARYEPGASNGRLGFSRLHHPPSASLMLPAPKRVRCDRCAVENEERSTYIG